MVLGLWGLISQVFAQLPDTSNTRLYKLSVSDILSTKSTLASGVKETVLDAPASMVVLTAKDIAQRGYTSLHEVVADLPEFDLIPVSGGNSYVNAYQRGYRTVNTQRTLFMIDGVVANDLWSHIAAFGEQFPMSSIERIEVLSGPASVVYGANAFLGIINVVTKREKFRRSKGNINFIGGSNQTGAIDASVRGNHAGIRYSVSARLFRSEAEDISDRWHFLSHDLYSNRDIWGPLLGFKVRGERLGTYRSLNEEFGLVANVAYRGLEAGIITWRRNNGYGNEFVADRAQNNANWNNGSNQYYLRHRLKVGKMSNDAILLYRDSRTWGDWAEAEPDWNPGREAYSYISFTNWNTASSSVLFRDNFNIKLNQKIQLLSGVKYERKTLAKNYDVPGYWTGSYSSTILENPEGPQGQGGGITLSTDPSFIISPTPNRDVPTENEVITHDIGGYLLGVFDVGKFRFNTGVRYDRNSVYGQSINPRASIIFKPNKRSAIKLLYGEAFQEPSPRSLWGGWNGRRANPDMKPEKVQNMEANLLYKSGRLLHEVIGYYALYDNVIKEEAENAGQRKILGLGYKLTYNIPNPIPHSGEIKGYLFYNYTDVKSGITYDHQAGEWVDGEANLGDIATHKLNLGIHVPIQRFQINLRSNMVGERELYLRNPLRDQDYRLAPYAIFNGNVAYNVGMVRLMIKVNNIFNHHYMLPGVRSANSGNDFTQRSQGYYNSLIPAPGRSFLLNAVVRF